MAGFHNVLFPPDISRGSRGGPEFRTRIIESAGGWESRNIEWGSARGRWNVAFGVRSDAQLDELIAFFHARYGRAYSFRFRDPLDNSAVLQPLQLNGKGQVQLAKTYVSGAATYVRFISLPVVGSLTGLPGGASVDPLTGIVTGAAAGTLLSFRFDVKARFDSDFLDGSAIRSGLGEYEDIPVVEVR